ncbi:hypothetical protein ABZP36_028258 [Zizania latifolia]
MEPTAEPRSRGNPLHLCRWGLAPPPPSPPLGTRSASACTTVGDSLRLRLHSAAALKQLEASASYHDTVRSAIASRIRSLGRRRRPNLQPRVPLSPPLPDGSAVSGDTAGRIHNLSAIVRQAHERLPDGDAVIHVSYTQDRYVFHAKRTDGITTLYMADEAQK